MDDERFWFPGPWIGGIALILGPLLLLSGAVLRIQFHFFFPQQLAAFQTHPLLIGTSYALFAAGNVMLWPAVITLAVMIGRRRSGWGAWGGTLAIFGLFARTHSAGIDHLAFQLVRVQTLDVATASSRRFLRRLRHVPRAVVRSVFRLDRARNRRLFDRGRSESRAVSR